LFPGHLAGRNFLTGRSRMDGANHLNHHRPKGIAAADASAIVKSRHEGGKHDRSTEAAASADKGR
jgi:hypothetical protein